MTGRQGRRCGLIAVGLLLTALAGACTPGGGTDAATVVPTGAPARAWSVITPPDVDPAALTTAGGRLLVGGASPAGSPALAVGSGASWEQASVTPVSGYGKQATLVHVGADPEGGVIAIGTATGGAHLNPRWTAWIGTVDGGITEEPQTVETFGGPDAGGITGVTAGHDPLVVGTWSLGAGGLAVTTWRHTGAIWQREPAADVLAGTGSAQTTATAASSTGVSVVIVGLQTSLSGGRIHQAAVAWTRPRGGTTWTRLALDPSQTDSAATDVACSDDGCVIAGRLGDRLALWRLAGMHVAPLTGVPERSIGRYTGQPRVAVDGARVAVADGVSAVLLSDPAVDSGPGTSRSRAVTGTTGQDGTATAAAGPSGSGTAAAGPSGAGESATDSGAPTGWRLVDAPPGEVRALTLTGGAVQLLARTADDRQVLYACTC